MKSYAITGFHFATLESLEALYVVIEDCRVVRMRRSKIKASLVTPPDSIVR